MPNTVLSSMAPAAHNSDKLSLNRSMLAPSPTLTNPDMILPYGEERESSTPSPALEDLQRAAEQSRLLASSYSLMHQRSTSVSTTTSCDRTSSGPDEPIQPYAAAYGTAEGSPQAMAGSGASASASASASANAGAVSGPMQSSQMSDIDLTIRTQSRRQSRASSTNSLDSLADPSGSAGLGASNGLSKRHSKVRELQDLPSGLFEQDKAHPDDEGAGVLGGADDLSAVVFEPEHRILPMGAIAEEDEDGEEKTESSDRSDRVYDELDELTSMLENAKLKLTHMEGNLNRARSSFRMTPSPSPSLNRAFGKFGGYYGYKGYRNRALDFKEFYTVSKDEILGLQSPTKVPRPQPQPIQSSLPLIQTYIRNSHAIISLILSRLASALDLPPESLKNIHRRDANSGDQIRWIKLQASKEARPPPENDVLLDEHSDSNSVTLIFNQSGGLQFRSPQADSSLHNLPIPRGNPLTTTTTTLTTNPTPSPEPTIDFSGGPNLPANWIPVNPLPGHCIILMGEQLAKLTEGGVRANVHRVCAVPGTQASSPRYSLVYFSRPEDDVILKQLAGIAVVPKPMTAHKSSRELPSQCKRIGKVFEGMGWVRPSPPRFKQKR